MFVLQCVQVRAAVCLVHFISAAVILLASYPVRMEFSLLYNSTGSATELYSLPLACSKDFCALNVLFVKAMY